MTIVLIFLSLTHKKHWNIGIPLGSPAVALCCGGPIALGLFLYVLLLSYVLEILQPWVCRTDTPTPPHAPKATHPPYSVFQQITDRLDVE